MIAGLDIGNGFVKGQCTVFGSTKKLCLDFPSSVAYVTHAHDIKTKDADAGSVIDDLFNEMDVSFDSDLVGDTSRRLFGRRGIESGLPVESFDVMSTLSKAQQPLSFILILGALAGTALKLFYEEHQTLPEEELKVDAGLALALPITEFKIHRKVFASRMKEHSHLVMIHNFETPVRVQIKISDVQVLAEGASAQYAITGMGTGLMDQMLKDLEQHGGNVSGITAQDVLSAVNSIGIDIGEGTVNLPVFSNGHFNPDASLTFSKGYGTVMENAVTRLPLYGNRRTLQAFLQAGREPLKASSYDRALAVVGEEMVSFCKEVDQEFRKVFSRVGALTQVIYVYGGGATNVKQVLYPMLLETLTKLTGGDSVPVLYLDGEYSRILNRDGLLLVAEKWAEAKAKLKTE